MKKLIIPALIAIAGILTGCEQKYPVDIHEVGVKVSENGLAHTQLGHYMGVSLYHAMADLALASGEKADMDRVMDILLRIKSGDIKMIYTTFMDYNIGGQAAALLALKGQTELVDETKEWAARMWKEQSRTSFGIMTSASYAPRDAYWIDIAFTVSPFFLYAGLLENNSEYTDYAAYYAIRCHEDLFDKETGLYHQGYNHVNRAGVSEDNWSRGNGWMSMALGALLRDYPRDGKYWDRIVSISKDFYDAVCKWQDENGMWHQEMSDLTSYVETSGSGQVLAGLGAAIEAGVLPKSKYMPCFMKGLKGLLGYVDPNGGVGHCCMGNCVPGNGAKSDFLPVHWYYNESHSFGPIVLAVAQAMKLGVKTVKLDAPLGSANDADRPRAYAKLVTERKNDVAWENDRVAFRVYSQIVANKAASGVDFWGKSVDYSIIDDWYAKESRNESYHKDTGTGCDFYNMGTGRGIGGTGIWNGKEMVCPQVYDKVEIADRGPARLEFTLSYAPYEAFGRTVTESKKIEMVCETSFYKVSHTVTTSDGQDAVLAIGLTTFGEAETIKEENGELYIAEGIKHEERVGIGTNNGKPRFSSELCGAVIVDPAAAAGTATFGNDRLQLVNVKSGQTITYYVGASWSIQQNSGRYSGGKNFWKMTAGEESYATLGQLYK